MKNSIAVDELFSAIHTYAAPMIIDVRRLQAFEEAERMIPTAYWRDHLVTGDWAREIPDEKEVVIYCVHSQQVSQAAVAILRSQGIHARYLTGGFGAWEAAGATTLPRKAMTAHQGKHWITRENPKIDRIACPWLIRRFIDPSAVFHYVEADWVQEIAVETGAIVFDVPGADTPFAHDRGFCSFDAFIRHFDMRDAALKKMAAVVRGAGTVQLDLAPQAAGLVALSLGLSALYRDDQEMLEKGMIFYDALYSWCRNASNEQKEK
ncbi:chromate resistance protein ChrB domain-containing protein [Candidatus Spongiihabitans sp.]|uniref:chromate resistance protein ChrB domain-containing protein n=1 Tax=Candidatus Spongiihabitans sp. TaxID=3101308 RepID=UPI003C7055E3